MSCFYSDFFYQIYNGQHGGGIAGGPGQARHHPRCARYPWVADPSAVSPDPDLTLLIKSVPNPTPQNTVYGPNSSEKSRSGSDPSEIKIRSGSDPSEKSRSGFDHSEKSRSGFDTWKTVFGPDPPEAKN